LQILKNENNQKDILFQVKSKISLISYSENEDIYDENYGYKYGIINDDNGNAIIKVWSNEFEYNSDIYIIEWYLSQ
jgi:hypothetical protein